MPFIAGQHVSQVAGLLVRPLTPCSVLMRESYAPLTRASQPRPWWARLLTHVMVTAGAEAVLRPVYVPTPVADDAATGQRGEPGEAAAAGRREGREEVRRLLGSGCQRPVLLFPEGSITNGRAGLMQFAQFSFGLGIEMQPVAIRARAALPLEADTCFASLLVNFVWMLFQPWTLYELHVLETMRAREGEEASRFARRAALAIGGVLGVEATSWTSQDKARHLRAITAQGKAAYLASASQVTR